MRAHTSWRRMAIAAALAAAAGSAQAHPARSSAILLDVGDTRVDAELHLPLDQLSLASPGLEAGGMADYVEAHVSAATPDGRAFDVEVASTEIAAVDGADHLVAHAALIPPPGASPRAFTLWSDAISHRVVSHKTYVTVRRDFDHAVFDGEPAMLGVLRAHGEAIAVDRTGGGWWRGAGAVFMLGARHITEGADHLLFVLNLMLPVTLVARDGRWGEPRSARGACREVLTVITAFTVGHSATLALGTLGAVLLPTRPVEVLIAASILVTALHALRPMIPRREAAIAAGFGLVHGLAFATSLGALGLSGGALGVSLVAFNLGVEAAQLGVIAAVLPVLLLLRGTAAYAPLRVGLAGFGAVAAVGWLVERAGPDGLSAALSTALTSAPL